MPANRQQRQHNPLTCTNTGQHTVSTRQHRQQNSQHPLTLLTPADTAQHTETPGQGIVLTMLTTDAPPIGNGGRA